MGFAPASLLYRHSFADVLQDSTHEGYQRRFFEGHSLEFRRYIQAQGSTTIPLTFNLRPSEGRTWEVQKGDGRKAILCLEQDAKVLSQVDCQHRLGFLGDQDVELAFMTFIGLTQRDEMEVFNRINSKAKGLSSSLLDFHQSKLASDLSKANPALFVALQLNERADSPWHRSLDLGGARTVGMNRRASLRTMQLAARRYIRECNLQGPIDAQMLADTAVRFWGAVAKVLSAPWADPRKHLLTKGIGVYALMSIAGDLVREAQQRALSCDDPYFLGALDDFLPKIDWSNEGDLKGLGGGGGADEATKVLRDVRRQKNMRLVARGK